MAKKRLYKRDLVQHDLKHKTTILRELEMVVDQCCATIDGGYSLQFWRDAELYGIAEAVQYLEQVPRINKLRLTELQDCCDGILRGFGCKLCTR